MPDLPIYAFDEYQLDPTRRALTRNGRDITLNPKAFDLLLALIENRDRVIPKAELLDRVWAGQFVEENNLAVQVSALRKIFGEKKNDHRFIVTVPGNGYRFVAGVRGGQNNGEMSLSPGGENGTPVLHRISTGPVPAYNDATFAPATNRRRWPLRYLVLIILAAAGTSVFYLRQSGSERIGFRTGENVINTGSIRRLTTTGNVQQAALSPDGRLFVYTTADFERQALWLGYVGGGEPVELRKPTEVSYNRLTFSSDGESIYYTANEPLDSPADLYRLPFLGGVPELIKKNIPSSLSFSPDASQIAFVRGVPGENRTALMVGPLDGSDYRELVSLPRPQSIDFESLSWSPDAKLIAFSARIDGNATRQNLYTVRVSDGSVEQVTRSGWAEIRRTAWLNDGSALLILAQPYGHWDSVFYEQVWHVAYPGGDTAKITADLSNYSTALNVSRDASALLSIEYRQMMNIWVAPVADLGSARQITFGSFGRNDGYTGLTWLPDGRIAFSSTVSNSQIASVMRSDGSAVEPLTTPGFVDSQLVSSPASPYIFFHSNRSGIFEIWRINNDGSDPVQLTTGGHNYQPYASADGRSVYYKSVQGGDGVLRRVSAQGGESEQLTKGECSWACTSPNGKYIACDYRTDKRRLAIFSADGGEPVKTFEFPVTALRWYGMHWTPDSRAVAYRDRFYGIWKQPLEDDAQPRRIEHLPKDKIYSFAWSHDGRHLAFVRGQEIRDVVLISGSTQ